MNDLWSDGEHLCYFDYSHCSVSVAFALYIEAADNHSAVVAIMAVTAFVITLYLVT